MIRFIVENSPAISYGRFAYLATIHLARPQFFRQWRRVKRALKICDERGLRFDSRLPANLGVKSKKKTLQFFSKASAKTDFQSRKENSIAAIANDNAIAGRRFGWTKFRFGFNGRREFIERPMRRILEPLTQMGAEIESETIARRLKFTVKIRFVNSYNLPVATRRLNRPFCSPVECRRQIQIQNPKSKTVRLRESYRVDATVFERGMNRIFRAESGFVEEITVDGNSQLAPKT